MLRLINYFLGLTSRSFPVQRLVYKFHSNEMKTTLGDVLCKALCRDYPDFHIPDIKY